jgi:hypothetical protein
MTKKRLGETTRATIKVILQEKPGIDTLTRSKLDAFFVLNHPRTIVASHGSGYATSETFFFSFLLQTSIRHLYWRVGRKLGRASLGLIGGLVGGFVDASFSLDLFLFLLLHRQLAHHCFHTWNRAELGRAIRGLICGLIGGQVDIGKQTGWASLDHWRNSDKGVTTRDYKSDYKSDYKVTTKWLQNDYKMTKETDHGQYTSTRGRWLGEYSTSRWLNTKNGFHQLDDQEWPLLAFFFFLFG